MRFLYSVIPGAKGMVKSVPFSPAEYIPQAVI